MSTPSSLKYRIAIGGLAWACAVQFFAAQVIVQAAWTTPFSLATNFISDLGNTACANYPAGGTAYVCSPWHAAMNVSFALQGVIIIAGALLTAPLRRPGRAGISILVLLFLTGLGLIGVGAFPENVDNDAHVYSAGLQFVTGNLVLVTVGVTRAIRRIDGRLYSVFSVMLGLTGLAATVLFPIDIHLGLGVGGMERVAAYTVPVWLTWTGILILRRSARGMTQWQK
jgi:hypothetical membrane protein